MVGGAERSGLSEAVGDGSHEDDEDALEPAAEAGGVRSGGDTLWQRCDGAGVGTAISVSAKISSGAWSTTKMTDPVGFGNGAGLT